MGQKFDMGAETLTMLNRQTQGQSENLGVVVKDLARASEPVEASFQGPGRAAFDLFQSNADAIAYEINRALHAILGGSVGMDQSVQQGVQQQADQTRGIDGSQDYSGFSGGA